MPHFLRQISTQFWGYEACTNLTLASLIFCPLQSLDPWRNIVRHFSQYLKRLLQQIPSFFFLCGFHPLHVYCHCVLTPSERQTYSLTRYEFYRPLLALKQLSKLHNLHGSTSWKLLNFFSIQDAKVRMILFEENIVDWPMIMRLPQATLCLWHEYAKIEINSLINGLPRLKRKYTFLRLNLSCSAYIEISLP